MNSFKDYIQQKSCKVKSTIEKMQSWRLSYCTLPKYYENQRGWNENNEAF